LDFEPPRCPNTACRNHTEPKGRFYWRHGHFVAACRPEPVPRFRCRSCGKGFSRQTFRHDYRDHRPPSNELLFQLVCSGIGMRQSGRMTKLTVSAVQMKMRKIGRTCRWLHRNLCRNLPTDRVYLLDEEESYETASIRTLTVPIVIEHESWFVVTAGVASTRRLAAAGTERRALQDREELRKGRRRDRSRACVRVALGRLSQALSPGPFVLRTDEKSSYRKIAKEVFGSRVCHETTHSTVARTKFNPLFAINTTMAMTRDGCSRLRRESWLASKRGKYLRLALYIFIAFRNYARLRFNRDKDKTLSSAAQLGLLPRALEIREILAWRQDWGLRSVHPMSSSGRRTVGEAIRKPA
jgi:transposase-like protein